MIGWLPLSAAVALASFMHFPFASANWDNCTGHLRDRAPSADWLTKNHAIVITKDIQVSECAMNTRTHFPYAQLFAWHFVNHSQDHYHGCTYGDCYAFTTFPRLNETVPDYTNSNSFYWHHLGGDPGIGVHPIANPQTGEFGYETSLKGKLMNGPAPAHEEQVYHDYNWPGWTAEAHKLVPVVSDMKTLSTVESVSQPTHPKCGRPCEPNKDPGQDPGKFGHYKPAPASAYSPPPDWKPTKADTCCTKSGKSPAVCKPSADFGATPGVKYPPSKPQTMSCLPLCRCLASSKTEETNQKCLTKHPKCHPQACKTNPYPGLTKGSSKKHQRRRH